MAAVVKIKRRLDEDPLETLILNCKRRKTNGSENNTNEELSAVLQLAGTSKEDESIEQVIRKRRLANASDLKRQFKKHDVDISKKIRSEIQDHSKNTRYRVVNCFRKNFNDELHEEPGNSNNEEVTIFELETDYNKNSASIENKNKETDQSKYVYDFYYTSSDDFGEADIEDYVSVYPLNDPLLFGSVRDNGLNESDSEYESEDSNAENNWKNDYPDEEDLESINENDMLEAVKNLDISEDLLSSDSGEEDFVYSKDEEDFQDCEQDIDKEDELRYGKLYAKFKAKNKNIETAGVSNDLYCGDIDENEYYY